MLEGKPGDAHPFLMGFAKFAVLATMGDLLQAIDWKGFFRIVLLVTIPAFWVPAPLALGVILAFARRHGPKLRVEAKHQG